MLASLATELQQSLSLLHKQDIQTASQALPTSQIPIGDDCAAIPDGDGFLLLAAEGMLPQFLETEPWFAGWSAVMVNISDIAAMGGRAIALVDTIWSRSSDATKDIWAGMKAAAQAYNVPIVGGHTNCHSVYNALSVAILGRATHLITSFHAQPGDVLLMVADFKGNPHPKYPFWDAATMADPARLRSQLCILPRLAETGLCNAGKDISNGGIIGTLLMLLETSRCGAVLNLDRIPCPPALSLQRWLVSFPSYGFLLSVRPSHCAAVQASFAQQDLVCEAVGEVRGDRQLVLRSGTDAIVFWDFVHQKLTGF